MTVLNVIMNNYAYRYKYLQFLKKLTSKKYLEKKEKIKANWDLARKQVRTII